MAIGKYSSTLLSQTNDPLEIQKADLDLLKKLNDVIDGINGLSIISSTEYIKFPDGTMIQWGKPSVPSISTATSNYFGSTSGTTYFSVLAVTWSPAFTSIPSVYAMAEGDYLITQSVVPSLTGVTFRLLSGVTIATTQKFSWIAIGKWK